MSNEFKTYDFILLGATGYTGKLCAQHITTNLPTDLKWAVAGRSSHKLESLVTELQELNKDRPKPAIETLELNAADLNKIVLKTHLILNCIGPYHHYSSPVIEACANNGTHYLDVTGETLWVKQMIEKYHDKAKATGAIIIPELGFESAPSDLIAWSTVATIRAKLSTGTREIICSLHDLNSPGMFSGGTLATVLTTFDAYSLKEIAQVTNPLALCPPGTSRPESPRSLFQAAFGYSVVPGLGILTTCITGGTNGAIVHRSSALMEALYGKEFRFREYMTVSNRFKGALLHWAWIAVGISLALPPVRWLLKRVVPSPGSGPNPEQTSHDRVEYRAIGTANNGNARPERARGRLTYEGGIYYLTGVFLAHAAMVILRDDSVAKRMGGGLLTPATLAQPLINRLDGAGVAITSEIMED